MKYRKTMNWVKKATKLQEHVRKSVYCLNRVHTKGSRELSNVMVYFAFKVVKMLALHLLICPTNRAWVWVLAKRAGDKLNFWRLFSRHMEIHGGKGCDSLHDAVSSGTSSLIHIFYPTFPSDTWRNKAWKKKDTLYAYSGKTFPSFLWSIIATEGR